MLEKNSEADAHDAAAAAMPQPYPPVPTSERAVSIRFLLNAVIAAILLPLLALNVFTAIRYVDAERRVVETRRFDAIGDVTELLHRDIEKSASALRVLATDVPLDPPAFRARAQSVIRLSSADRLTLYDRQGRPIVSTTDDAPRLDASGPAGAEFFVSNLVEGEGGVRRSFLIAAPAACPGGGCMLVATYALSRYAALFDDARVPGDWTAGLTDRNGVVLARNRLADQFVGRSARGEVIDIIKSGASDGVFENVTLDGIPVSNVFRRSPLTGWLVVVSVPRTTMNAALWRALLLLGVIGLASIAIALAFASFLASRIARSLRRLSGAAVALVDGGRPQLADQRIAELAEVQRAFDYAGSIAQEHRETQSRLRSSELFFRLLIDSAAEGIFAIDRDGVLTICNAAFLRLIGREAGYEIVGRPLHEVVRHANAFGVSIAGSAGYSAISWVRGPMPARSPRSDWGCCTRPARASRGASRTWLPIKR